MKVQIHPIFPETVVEYNNIGADQDKLQRMYEVQEWVNTNSEDNPDYFLKISKNLKVLDGDDELKNKFVRIINDYGVRVMSFQNDFRMTTSWFTKTESNNISVLHNHGNAMVSAVYYFGLTEGNTSRIKFEKPFISQFDLAPRTYNEFNCITYNFEFGNDTMLIFPSYMKHKVMRHENKETRKSLAMNFLPIGQVGDSLTEIDLGDQ